MNQSNPSDDVLGSLAHVLQSSGVQAGVELLNARVPHRYTCVFELKGGILKSLYVVDKLKQLTPASLKVVELKDSFCQFVLRDGIFATFSSSNDERVEDVKATETFDAYVGVPLLDNYGDLFGTLCHVDASALDIPAEEFALLEKAARLLPTFIQQEATARLTTPE